MTYIASAKETSEQQATTISESETKIYAMQSRPRYPRRYERKSQPKRNDLNQNKLCRPPILLHCMCGQKNHLAKDCRCSREITCFKCNKQGHYTRQCVGHLLKQTNQKLRMHFIPETKLTKSLMTKPLSQDPLQKTMHSQLTI